MCMRGTLYVGNKISVKGVTCRLNARNIKGRPRRIYDNNNNNIFINDLQGYILSNNYSKCVVKVSVVKRNKRCNVKSVKW